MHAKVDTRLEGRIDILNTIGGEEENAFVVLEHAEEDGYEFVALEVLRTTLLKKDIGFIKEEDSIPLSSHLEDVRQR